MTWLEDFLTSKWPGSFTALAPPLWSAGTLSNTSPQLPTMHETSDFVCSGERQHKMCIYNASRYRPNVYLHPFLFPSQSVYLKQRLFFSLSSAPAADYRLTSPPDSSVWEAGRHFGSCPGLYLTAEAQGGWPVVINIDQWVWPPVRGSWPIWILKVFFSEKL